MIAATKDRVERNTAASLNEARQDEIQRSVDYHRARPQEIPARLAELDREWDIERAIEANAATVALAGLALAAFVDRRFLAVPVGVAAFLMQHAVQGWCPPVPLLRRLGFRTPAEICEERCRLRLLRGEEAGQTDGQTGWRVEPAVRPFAASEEIHEAVDA